MASKLKLDLEALSVESFPVAGRAGDGRGTVRGNSFADTEWQTCGGWTCGATCNFCGDTVVGCYTRPGTIREP